MRRIMKVIVAVSILATSGFAGGLPGGEIDPNPPSPPVPKRSTNAAIQHIMNLVEDLGDRVDSIMNLVTSEDYGSRNSLQKVSFILGQLNDDVDLIKLLCIILACQGILLLAMVFAAKKKMKKFIEHWAHSPPSDQSTRQDSGTGINLDSPDFDQEDQPRPDNPPRPTPSGSHRVPTTPAATAVGDEADVIMKNVVNMIEEAHNINERRNLMISRLGANIQMSELARDFLKYSPDLMETTPVMDFNRFSNVGSQEENAEKA